MSNPTDPQFELDLWEYVCELSSGNCPLDTSRVTRGKNLDEQIRSLKETVQSRLEEQIKLTGDRVNMNHANNLVQREDFDKRLLIRYLKRKEVLRGTEGRGFFEKYEAVIRQVIVEIPTNR